MGRLRGPGVLHAARVTADDLRASGAIDVLGTGDWSGEVIVRDGCGFVDFDNGISLHFAREAHLADLETAATLHPCVSVKLFLEGAVEAEIGGRVLPMPERRGARAWAPAGAIVGNRRPARFRRHARGGSHLVKVIVDLPHDWLHRRLAPAERAALAPLLDADLEVLPWAPGAEEVAAARRLFTLPAGPAGGIAAVRMESAALGMVAGALQAVRAAARPQPDRRGDRRDADHDRIARFRALVAALPDGAVDIAALAAGMALSPSTLQRLVQRSFGCSVQAFVRRHRLESARAALLEGRDNIARIAWRAGYGSPANFATAFGRAFGCRPSDLRRGGKPRGDATAGLPISE